jgi:hypothetical protein
MADFRNFDINYLGTAGRNVHQFALSATVHDSQSGEQLADVTGANREVFVFNTTVSLDSTQRRELVEAIATYLLYKKAGM